MLRDQWPLRRRWEALRGKTGPARAAAGPAARRFLEALPAQGLQLLDLPTPSPFAFGLFTAGGRRRDTMQLADTADFLLAMYEKVQARMRAEPVPAQAELFT
jgi:hypothetical protein